MLSTQSLTALGAVVAALGAHASPTPRAVTPVGWQSPITSCIAEGTSGRALTGAFLGASDMTYEKCTSFCASKGYGLAGLEWSTECYCGDSLVNGASLNSPSSNCNRACGGDSTSICGGGNALTIFATADAINNLASDLTIKPEYLYNSGWALTTPSCVAEGTEGRALNGPSMSSNDMTGLKCTNWCQSLGFIMAGTEYSRECYCGNGLVNGASLDRPSSSCNMPCTGNRNSICGGPGALTLYENPSVNNYLALSSSGLRLVGCIKDVPGRALTGRKFDFVDMTIDQCTDACKDAGFKYAGAEHGSECFCGNTLDNGASVDVTTDQCWMPCPGAPHSRCGGPDALQLYTH